MNIEEYAKHKYFFTMEIPDLLLRYSKKFKWNSFLDLGCGDGNLLYTLNKEGYLKGKQVYAIDLSKKRIARVKSIDKNFKCYVNDACDLKDIKNNSIDLLASTMVIEHVPDDRVMVKEIYRVLNPKGNLAYVNTVFKKWYGWYWYRNHGKWTLDPTHLREYTDDSLLKIFEEEGFKIIETKKTLLWFSFVNMIVRILSMKGNTMDNKFFKILDKIKFPIPGYYNWEIVCRKI
jgi:ubiquinone/menaquinone biosynthesis C-methylase UbiE